MSLRQGTLTASERTPLEVSASKPTRAYFQNHPTVAGRYVLGTAVNDATAFLGASSIASATGRHLLYDTSAEETRALYLTDATRVIA